LWSKGRGYLAIWHLSREGEKGDAPAGHQKRKIYKPSPLGGGKEGEKGWTLGELRRGRKKQQSAVKEKKSA